MNAVLELKSTLAARGRVLSNLAALGAPRHSAYVIGSGTMIGSLAEAIAASVNTNADAWKLGPPSPKSH